MLGEVKVNEEPLCRGEAAEMKLSERKGGTKRGETQTERGRWDNRHKRFEKKEAMERQEMRTNCKGVWLHFWDNEKFIAPSPAASLNQRRICIADGPGRNKINLSLISPWGVKNIPITYSCLCRPWHRGGGDSRDVSPPPATMPIHATHAAWTWDWHPCYGSHVEVHVLREKLVLWVQTLFSCKQTYTLFALDWAHSSGEMAQNMFSGNTTWGTKPDVRRPWKCNQLKISWTETGGSHVNYK